MSAAAPAALVGGPPAAGRVASGGNAAIVIARRAGRDLTARRGGLEYRPAGPTGGQERTQENSIETEAEIEAKVIDIVAEQMGVDKGTITRETNFTNDLHADSLDTVELVMEFEDEFETSIPDEKAEKIQTIGQAIEFIKDSIGVDV